MPVHFLKLVASLSCLSLSRSLSPSLPLSLSSISPSPYSVIDNLWVTTWLNSHAFWSCTSVLHCHSPYETLASLHNMIVRTCRYSLCIVFSNFRKRTQRLSVSCSVNRFKLLVESHIYERLSMYIYQTESDARK